jgi:hypothetical protein
LQFLVKTPYAVVTRKNIATYIKNTPLPKFTHSWHLLDREERLHAFSEFGIEAGKHHIMVAA